MMDKICLIGSGNLGSKLAHALHNADIQIAQVISRTLENAKLLAESVNADYSDNIHDFNEDCNIIILAVSDDAVLKITSHVDFGDRLLVHTAGSVDITVFENHKGAYGVFYPLQTFQKDRKVDFKEIPIFIEGNTNESTLIIETLAKKLSQKVYRADSGERLRLHIAAVFACNFTNHLFGISYDLLKNSDYGIDAILPLIKETTDKILQGGNPHELQTGPALRNDIQTMGKHLNELREEESLSELYKFMSNRIFETKKKND